MATIRLLTAFVVFYAFCAFVCLNGTNAFADSYDDVEAGHVVQRYLAIQSVLNSPEWKIHQKRQSMCLTGCVPLNCGPSGCNGACDACAD